jgi:hypothetical protein
MDTIDLVRDLYPRLIEGDIGVLSSFNERATVDSPLGGRQLPPEFVGETRAWLARHDASMEPGITTVADRRVAHELTLQLTIEGHECELPLLLIADLDGDSIRDLRIYHSTWPLYGSHEVRHPILHSYHEAIDLAEPVASYHQAVWDGDAEKADAQFEPDGTVREPSGSKYAHSGSDRTDWYRRILSKGGIKLHVGAVTDDGTTTVFEFLVDQWGGEHLPSQAGAAAYTRGSSGKIASARIYDDVTPPEAVSG